MVEEHLWYKYKTFMLIKEFLNKILLKLNKEVLYIFNKKLAYQLILLNC